MTKKRIILTGAAILIGGAIVARIVFPPKPQITYDTAVAERGMVAQTVEATGAVVSSGDVELKFEISGRITSLKAAVGDDVKAGQELAAIDDRDARVNVQRANAQVITAQASYDKLRSGATAEDIRVAETSVANAETSLVLAEQALADARQAVIDTAASNEAALDGAYADMKAVMETLLLKSSSTIQTLASGVFDTSDNLRSDILSPDSNLAAQAAASYKAAKDALARMGSSLQALRAATDRTLSEQLADAILTEGRAIRDAAQISNTLMQGAMPQGSTTEAAFDARRNEVKAAWTEMVAAVNAAESSRLRIATVKASNQAAASASQSRVNSAEQNVRVAKGSLETAKANLAARKAPASSFDVESARAQLASAQAALSAARLELEKFRLKAPFDGTVAQVSAKVGQTVTPANIILKIHGEDVYEIEADVPETDIAKLAVGMDALVDLDAYGEEKKFPAKLASIDTAETVIQDIVYYKTRFLLASPDQPVRTGMTANVAVIAQKRDGVLFVPLRAVRTNGEGERYVRILKDGAETQAIVTVGLRGDDNRVEVTSGLSEGDVVILAVRENGKVL